jgi:YfiH family protein
MRLHPRHDPTIILAMDIEVLKVPRWENHQGLVHGFSTRRGGKSVGVYAGLNMSYRVGDDPKVVSQNVCDMKLAIGIHEGRVVTMKQVHGDSLVEVQDANMKEAGEADALITAKSGIFLGVLTADCVPIIMIAPANRIAAVVHAGWRGTLAGLAAKAVRYLAEEHRVEPATLEAALGPAIGLCCYEVGQEVAEPLRARWGGRAADAISSAYGKPHVDLRALNHGILLDAGLTPERVFDVGPCTKCAGDDFFSYRREGKETGRQMSVVGWEP